MKRDINNHTCQGMYTVEAALVFPIVFFVILFLLNYSFYHYDKARLQSEIDDIMRKSSVYLGYEIELEDKQVEPIETKDKNALSIFFDDQKPREAKLEEYISNRLRKGYYVMNFKDIKATSTYSKIRVTGKVDIKFYGYHWINRFFGDRFTFVFNQSEKKFPREETARLLEAAISSGNQIKGVEEAVGQLAKFIGYIH